jgi:uncharacterized protein YecE (DUF72 family)
VYPPDLPSARWLSSYAGRFATVEVNNTFYRLPEESTFAAWRAQVPRGFRFAVKASRFITHVKRLRDPEEPLERLFTRLRPLGAALGPVLYQLPPRWCPDTDRLEMFLSALPARLPGTSHRLHHVMEMRDSRGYEECVLELLVRHRVSLCVHDMPGSASPRLATGPIVYVRLHGSEQRYGGTYPDVVLDDWAAWIRRMLAEGYDVYTYFNNDMHGHAVSDAERLRLRVEGGAPRAAAALGVHRVAAGSRDGHRGMLAGMMQASRRRSNASRRGRRRGTPRGGESGAAGDHEKGARV